MNKSNGLWLLAFLVALVLGFVSYHLFMAPSLEPESAISHGAYNEGDGELGLVIPAITLQSAKGEYALLKPDGKLRILYFGYSHCPDVCPTSLSVLATALYQINDAQLAKVEPLFITVDPRRDDKYKMAEFAAFFHPKLRGLSGDKSKIERLAKRLGVLYNYVTMADSAMEYSVDHSSFFYFISDDGRLLKRIPHTYDPSPVVKAIVDIVGE